jgi:reactive intermediate/imine deaminase
MASQRETFNPAELPAPVGVYAQVTRNGRFVFISGQNGIDVNGNHAEGLEAQTIQTLENVRGALAAAGATFSDVMKLTIYMTNIADRPKIREIRERYFPGERPAVTTIGVAALYAPESVIEIDAIAILPED